MFDRLRHKLTESQQRRQADTMAATGRLFVSRRTSHEKEGALSGATVATTTVGGGGGPAALPVVAARRNVELDAGNTRADDRGLR